MPDKVYTTSQFSKFNSAAQEISRIHELYNRCHQCMEKGQLDDANINAPKFIPGRGIFEWAQRTAQRKQSALRDINVRRMLLFVETSIKNELSDFLFEPNNATTRGRVRSVLNSFLSTRV